MAKGGFSAANHYYVTSPVTSTPLTFCTWTNREDEPGSWVVMGLCATTGSIFSRIYGWFLVGINGDWGAQVRSYNTIYRANVSCGGAGDRSKWGLVCATFDSNDTDRAVYYYMNGSLSSDTDSNYLVPGNTTDRLSIGVTYQANNSVGSDVYPYYLSRPAAWSTVLTENEVRMIALGASPLQIQPDHLFFYADMIRYKGNKKSETPISEVGTVPTQPIEPSIQVTVPFAPDNSQSNTGGGSGRVLQSSYGLRMYLASTTRAN